MNPEKFAVRVTALMLTLVCGGVLWAYVHVSGLGFLSRVVHAAAGPDHPEAENGEADAHGDHGHGAPESHDGQDDHDGHEDHEEGVVHLPPERLEGLNITLVPVHEGTVNTTLSLPAEVAFDPDNEAHLVPRVRGIVREVFVGIGDQVEEGQLLAVLDSRELADAKAQYLAALAMSNLAQTNYTREKNLWEQKISAERDYLEARAEYQAAQIRVRTAAQELHALGLSADAIAALPKAEDASLTRYEIRSPFAATVVARHIALGETVGEEDEVFFVAKLDPVWIMGRATERDLRRLHKGQEALVRLDAYPGDEFQGAIDYIGSMLDVQSRTVDVRLVLPNPERQLRAGLFGQMMLFVGDHAHDGTLLVPNDALQRTPTGGTVYKVVGEGEFRAIPVDVLHASDTFTEVQGDLKEGDRVAAGDVFVLKSEAGKAAMGGGHSH